MRIHKLKRFKSEQEFKAWLKEKGFEEPDSISICDDYEHRIYVINEKVRPSLILKWTLFVFEKEDIEKYSAEVKASAEAEHLLLYDQKQYDD